MRNLTKKVASHIAAITLIAVLLLASCAGGAGAAASLFLEIGDALVDMYQRDASAALWDLTEEQQNAALLLMTAGLLSREEAYGAPSASVAQRAAGQADGDELLTLAVTQWQDGQTQFVVPHCTFNGSFAVIDLQPDEYIRLIQQDDKGRWHLMPPVTGQAVMLPPNTLFLYSYPGSDGAELVCISRAPGEGGDFEQEEELEPDKPAKRRCGHSLDASGKHGRIPTCGNYWCNTKHKGPHDPAPCGIVGHWTCDKKDHESGQCDGERRPDAIPQDELEECGLSKHVLGTEGDHTRHSACGKWLCTGTHDVPACGNDEHCTLDGKQHGQAACKAEGHTVCDRESHAAAKCKISGHFACDGADHSKMPCGKHYGCDPKADNYDCDHWSEPDAGE